MLRIPLGWSSASGAFIYLSILLTDNLWIFDQSINRKPLDILKGRNVKIHVSYLVKGLCFSSSFVCWDVLKTNCDIALTSFLSDSYLQVLGTASWRCIFSPFVITEIIWCIYGSSWSSSFFNKKFWLSWS